jgi:L,D-peptidoglycan transpeptidase YkuD (ErfK/YbiS/YcfS/YnhG family)
MIIVKKTGFLSFLNKKYKCSLGYSGVKKNKKEGDGGTPYGIYNLTKIYYRKDKIKKLQSSLKKIVIKKNMIWCDDSDSQFYNTQSYLPKKFSYEKFYRKDNIYDIIVIIDYNLNPIKKNKGSAIFLHIAKKNYKPTKGCIALKKQDLLFILKNCKKKTKIKIN